VQGHRALAWLLVASAFALAGALAKRSATLADPVLVLAAAASAIELVLVALAVSIALLAPGSARARLGLLRPRLGASDTLVLVAGTLGLSHALDALLALTGLYEGSELAAFARSMHGTRGLPLALALLAIGLLPAVAEEILCRGVLQRSLVPRLGAAPGVAVAALVFGLLHVEPVHAGFAVLLGLYLGAMAWASGSVWTPIACHAVNNVAATLGAAFGGPSVPGSPAQVALGLCVAAGALAFVWRRFRMGLQKLPGSDDG
jgi:membrane protease YdiL (CAAX protease family)